MQQVEKLTAHGRPQRARHVEDHGVERHRVGQILAASHIHDERQPRRQVEGLHHSARRGDGQHLPDSQHAGEVKPRQEECQQHVGSLRPKDERPLGQAVGQHAAPGAEKKGRQDLGNLDQGRPFRFAGLLVRQPAQRGRLHPGSHQGNKLTEEVEPVVAMPQGAKGDREGSVPGPARLLVQACRRARGSLGL